MFRCFHQWKSNSLLFIIWTTLRNPRGIFVDENSSTLFVPDCVNDRIQSFQLGSFLGKTILTNQTFDLNCPSGIVLDKQVYSFVVDQQNHRIPKLDLNGNLQDVSCGYSCLNTTISTIAFDTVGNYSMNETFPLSYVSEWIGLTVYFTCINYTYLSTKKHITLNNRSFTTDLTKVLKI